MSSQEVQRTREELLAFLRDNTNDASTLRGFIADSASLLNKDDESSDDEVIREVTEEGRDDEDFIMLLQPKAKNKDKRNIVRTNSQKSKRKCEFCGTIETPMWRRGPTGKGTLCNACGVKWSLKFRKRAGKKPLKTEKVKEEPREQRQSSRKKVSVKRQVPEPLEGELSSPPPSLESGSQSVGLCCNHSVKRKREREEDNPVEASKRGRESQDEEFLSDDSPPSSHQLLGKLLNVVEVQLVEEEELERVRKQMVAIRSEFDAKERLREKQFEQTRANALNELLEFRRELAAIQSPHAADSAHKVAQSCEAILESFSNSLKNQLNEMKKSLGTSEELTRRLEEMQAGVADMQTRMESSLAALVSKSASDSARLEELFNSKEENIRNGWAFLQRDAKQEYAVIHRKLDAIEEAIN